jgi:hypothetical protein
MSVLRGKYIATIRRVDCKHTSVRKKLATYSRRCWRVMLLTKSTSSAEVVGNRGFAGCDGAVALLAGLYTACTGSAGRPAAVVAVAEESAAPFTILPKLHNRIAHNQARCEWNVPASFSPPHRTIHVQCQHPKDENNNKDHNKSSAAIITSILATVTAVRCANCI